MFHKIRPTVVFVVSLLSVTSVTLGTLCCGSARADTIDDAVAHVKGMVRAGNSRIEIGRWVAKKLDNRIKNLNSPWEGKVLGALGYEWGGASEGQKKAFNQWRNKGVFSSNTAAKWAWRTGVGQCEEHACTAYYILSNAGVSGRLQIVGTKGHAFVVWGMAKKADINSFRTWGDDTVIVDGWLGKTSSLKPVRAGPHGSAINMHAIYLGQKQDHTPAFAGNLVIGGPWKFVINWRDATQRQDGTPLRAEMVVKQIGDTFTAEITKGELKVELSKGRIYETGLMKFQWAAGPLNGSGLFRFDDPKSFKGRYVTKIVFDGKSYQANVPFTGTVDTRTITLFPKDPTVRGN